MKDRVRSVFARNLTRYREKAGITRRDVAEKLNLALPAYAHYEVGDRSPKLEYLPKISVMLHVSIDELLGNPYSGYDKLAEMSEKLKEAAEKVRRYWKALCDDETERAAADHGSRPFRWEGQAMACFFS